MTTYEESHARQVAVVIEALTKALDALDGSSKGGTEHYELEERKPGTSYIINGPNGMLGYVVLD